MRKLEKKYGQSRFLRRNTVILSFLLMIPVAVIAIVNFTIIYHQNISSTENDLRIASEQKLELMNNELNILYKLVNERRTDTNFYTKSQSDLTVSYYAISKTLAKDSVWTSFFDSVNYYNRESGLIYTYNTVKHEGEFLGQAQGERDDSLTGSQYSTRSLQLTAADFQRLQRTGNEIRTMRVHNVGEGNGVLIAAPLELEEDQPPASYILFTISDKTLENLWGSTKGASCLLLYNDIPIYDSDPAVREDIYAARSLSALYNPANTLTYRYKANGVTVWWRINKFLLIENLIPVIFLETVVTFVVMVLGILLILHASRRSYEPIQHILQRLSVDGTQEKFVDEFKCIDYALDDLAYSKRFLEESNQEMRREKYLYYILDNQVESGSALEQQCLRAGIHVERKYFACILLDDTQENYTLFETLSAMEDKDTENLNVYSLYIMENKYLFLVTSDLPRRELTAFLQKLSQENEDFVSVSEVVGGVQNIRSAYMSIRKFQPEEPGAPAAAEYPQLELQSLQEAVEAENIDKVEFSLRMIKNQVAGYNETIRGAVLMAVCTTLCQGESGRAKELISKVPGLDVQTVCQAIDTWFTAFLKHADEKPLPQGKHLPRNLHTILQYIETNCTSPVFSIKYMAAEFGTSPSNLSHQFKKATGQTLSRFIDELRIQQAEAMLAAGDPVNSIAKKLGYSTTPVFTETFKRLRGVTPSAFRTASLFGKNGESK